SSTPATLSQNGEVWFMHPVAMVDYYMEGKKTETWDKVTNSRIALLHPKIRQIAVNFINEVEKEFGIQLRVTTGLRTIEEQNRLYEQGRTTSGNIVTWVKGGYSYHNYGLAIDVIEMKNNNVNWDESVLKKISPVGIRNGFSWGGDWEKQKDYPHFEITFGYKASELLKKHNEGELDNEGYIIFN
ncbi:M15 family metallopeptidase, partial [Gilliamella sp. B3000]|uniref:M15 family metallopeptidase n=2 Tax=unclassified Gilliamella TaxID=2685620 RepID=UPI002269DE00